MKMTILNIVILMSVVLSAICALKAQSASKIKPSVKEEAVVLETSTLKLHGTLALPASKSRWPVVLIISGSGPTDRNGNIAGIAGSNNSLKMLADGLAVNGIASLRYDKRGIGESVKALGNEADLRFDAYIDDAVLWSKQLRSDKRFSTLTIVGHSEGSLIGMVAAQGSGADGYVSLAGSGRPAGQLILDQLRPQLPPDMMKESEGVVAALTAGKTVDTFPQPLFSIFRPSVQPYMISWFRYDPAVEIAKLSVPVLIIQGTTDIQIKVDEARLLAKAKPSAQLIIVEGMNHVLKNVPTKMDEQTKSYGDPSLPLMPQVVTETVKFVKKVERQKR